MKLKVAGGKKDAAELRGLERITAPIAMRAVDAALMLYDTHKAVGDQKRADADLNKAVGVAVKFKSVAAAEKIADLLVSEKRWDILVHLSGRASRDEPEMAKIANSNFKLAQKEDVDAALKKEWFDAVLYFAMYGKDHTALYAVDSAADYKAKHAAEARAPDLSYMLHAIGKSGKDKNGNLEPGRSKPAAYWARERLRGIKDSSVF